MGLSFGQHQTHGDIIVLLKAQAIHHDEVIATFKHGIDLTGLESPQARFQGVTQVGESLLIQPFAHGLIKVRGKSGVISG